MSSLTLGVDPGRILRECDATGVFLDGTGNPPVKLCGKLVIDIGNKLISVNGYNWFVNGIAAAVIEWPHTIPGKGGKDIDRAIRTAAIVADRLHCLGVPVFTPSRTMILSQMGRKVREQGNQDTWVKSYLEGIGYRTGPGTVLKNTHRRAALAAALWNWRDPRNEQMRYNPDEEE